MSLHRNHYAVSRRKCIDGEHPKTENCRGHHPSDESGQRNGGCVRKRNLRFFNFITSPNVILHFICYYLNDYIFHASDYLISYYFADLTTKRKLVTINLI